MVDASFPSLFFYKPTHTDRNEVKINSYWVWLKRIHLCKIPEMIQFIFILCTRKKNLMKDKKWTYSVPQPLYNVCELWGAKWTFYRKFSVLCFFIFIICHIFDFGVAPDINSLMIAAVLYVASIGHQSKYMKKF